MSQKAKHELPTASCSIGKAARDQKDIEIINRNADRLNGEAKDTLEYQALLELEDRDRRGYKAQPQKVQEFRTWQDAAAWPDD